MFERKIRFARNEERSEPKDTNRYLVQLVSLSSRSGLPTRQTLTSRVADTGIGLLSPVGVVRSPGLPS